MDAVSDRDFIVEYLAASALIMAHCSRFSEELIIWSSQEFGYISLPDDYTTGSSIMPQKRNPDFAEITRGKTGRVYGDLFALLTIMKGLPLTYNRDMQEDKPPLFDAADTVTQVLLMLSGLINGLSFDGQRMLNACSEGFLAATELADYLARKGMPFREAHGVIRNLVAACKDKKIRFSDLTIEEIKQFSRLFDTDVLEFLNAVDSIEQKKSYGGTSRLSVKQQIRKLQKLVL
jgi:argininosuccinate lyase